MQPSPQDNISPLYDPKSKIQQVEWELNELFLEREEAIRALLCALLTSENAVLLGPPGTAKSQLSRAICSTVTGWTYFRGLLSRFSTSEQILGPFSTRAMKDDDAFRRKTASYLPEAKIAFIDEIFKANSAILNELLPVLEEKEFFDDGQMKPIPLKMLVGASNEMPRDRNELGALWDRFTVRINVSNISDPAFESLQRDACRPRSARITERATSTRLTEDEFALLSEQVQEMDATGVAPVLAELRRKLREQNIRTSHRRDLKLVRLVCAQALLSGRDAPGEEDLSILTNVLWDDPAQAPAVRKVVMKIANPSLNAAIDLMDEANELYQKAISAPEEEKTAAGTDANSNLKRVQNRLLDLRKEASADGRSTGQIDAYLDRARAMNKEVMTECLGIDI
jgi:MoxR-like ATPase